jgi:hypothetical protein
MGLPLAQIYVDLGDRRGLVRPWSDYRLVETGSLVMLACVSVQMTRQTTRYEWPLQGAMHQLLDELAAFVDAFSPDGAPVSSNLEAPSRDLSNGVIAAPPPGESYAVWSAAEVSPAVIEQMVTWASLTRTDTSVSARKPFRIWVVRVWVVTLALLVITLIAAMATYLLLGASL